MLPLGFRFDVAAVIVDGIAHRTDCVLLGEAGHNHGAVEVAAGGVYLSQRCPRVCACTPRFETLLTHQVDALPSAGTP
jgi:hypothetical protein